MRTFVRCCNCGREGEISRGAEAPRGWLGFRADGAYVSALEGNVVFLRLCNDCMQMAVEA